MIVEHLLPALVVLLLRASDVSLGTVRTLFAVQGRRGIAAAVASTEALCFIGAAGIVFSDLTDPFKIAGYGVGVLLGVTTVRTLRLGTATVRMVHPAGAAGPAEALWDAGFGLTVMDGHGRDGAVRMLHALIRRRDLARFLEVARPWRERCFVSVGEEPLGAMVQPSAIAVRK